MSWVFTDRVLTIGDRRQAFGHSPKGQVLIGGVLSDCVLDTGAEASMVSFAYYHKHLAPQGNELGDVGNLVQLVAANNLEIPVEGFVEVPVIVCGHELKSILLVARDGPSGPSKRRIQFSVLIK